MLTRLSNCSSDAREGVGLSRRSFAQSLSGVALGLCLPSAFATRDGYHATQELMGTRVAVSLRGGSQRDMASAAEAAFGEMKRLADSMSRFSSTSTLSGINRMAGIGPVTVHPELMSVLQMAQHAHVLSDGAFDATVGSYKGWRFGAPNQALPSAKDLVAQRASVNQSDGLVLSLNDGTAYLKQQGSCLDLGGIAKLPILQAGMAKLQARGVSNALINGGGDVVAIGRSADRPWHIGLRDPRRPTQLMGSVNITQGWVAASGDYERFFVQAGRRWHHILDPKTGYPSQGVRGVALMGRELETINGVGTAIMVAGGLAGRSIAQKIQGVDALIVDSKDQAWLSAGMARHMKSVQT